MTILAPAQAFSALRTVGEVLPVDLRGERRSGILLESSFDFDGLLDLDGETERDLDLDRPSFSAEGLSSRSPCCC